MSPYTATQTVLIDDWLRTVLGTPATPVAALSAVGITGVYDHKAPPDAVYPFIVWQLQSATDVTGNGPETWMVDTLYAVKALSETDTYEVLTPIVDALNPILVGVTVSFGGGFITASKREEQIRLVEEIEGRQVRHLGGLYRIFAEHP